ncbi:hypothetical protein D3C72_1606960 [compost metagenome]
MFWFFVAAIESLIVLITSSSLITLSWKGLAVGSLGFVLIGGVVPVFVVGVVGTVLVAGGGVVPVLGADPPDWPPPIGVDAASRFTVTV